MTGQLAMPPSFKIKKFWPKVAATYAENGQRNLTADVNGGDVTVSWEGGISPFIVVWGDGKQDTQEASPAHHLYHVDGNYTVTVRDIVGQTSTVDVTISGATPAAAEGDLEPAPWDDMTRHADLDGYLDAEDIAAPDGWSSMTIAQKKQWLDLNG